MRLPRNCSRIACISILVLLVSLSASVAFAAPAFVQVNSAVPQSGSVSSVQVTYTAAQTVGNLNVVLVGWNDATATVSAISDTSGNTYALAIGPTRNSSISHSIYYAKNIAAATAGANRVTVTFSPATAYPDVRILEYSGIDTSNPLDVTKAGTGTNASATSGAVTTTNANDLLVAGNVVATSTTVAGAGFTNRVITSPDGDIAEDMVVTTAGSYTATATLSSAGVWIMQMAAFRATPSGPVDVTPPSAPSNLSAVSPNSAQINLSWTASTDNIGVTGYRVERCQGTGCSNFTQIATPTATSFNDTGLTPSTPYNYRVRATDAANNLSLYSNTASTTTQVDTTAPTAPTNLAATAASVSQINLTWTASTDNVAVTGYRVERCQGASCTTFAQIATPTVTSFSDTGLAANTSYSYRVLATDAAGNLSNYSNTATTSTPANDTTPPTAPSNLAASVISSSQINLTWTASTDNIAVTGYRVERCAGASCTTFAQVGTPASTSFSDTGLTAATSYSYRVRATDAAGNLGNYSNTATATTSSQQSVTPAFVQVASGVPQSSSVASVLVTYANAQTAGNLNVVIVGWNDTKATVTAVSDTVGNVYTRVVGPTAGTGLSQSIYYANNIAPTAAGVNKVTVTFSVGAAFPDVRILEYSGIDATNPIDVFAGASGNSANSTTSAVATTNPTDLLVAGNMVSTNTTGPGSGFTSRVITSPDGDIAEDRVVTALGSYAGVAPVGSGAWVMQMVAFRAAGSAPPPPDTIPPTVSITAPTQGATVTGVVSLSATASDNRGVVGVQFKVDGTNVGTEATIAPYGTNWDSTGFAAGNHAVTAVARDAAGNSTTSSSVTVNLQSAGTLGEWQGPFAEPMVTVHASLMPNGKILALDGQDSGTFSRVWDPTSNTFTSVTAPQNVFCTGHTVLPDGRVLVVGGHSGAHVGLTATNIFNPQTQTWTVANNMQFARWYPTATVMSDGRVLVMSGETNCDGCIVTKHEIFNPTTGTWTTMPASTDMSFAYYPHNFILPDGRLLVSSTTEAPIISRIFNFTTQAWSSIGSTALDGGAAIQYLPGKILKLGTSVNPDLPDRPSFPTAYVLDMTQSNPAWRQISSMAFARTYVSLVSLPDGTVFVVGGSTTTDAVDASTAVYQPELWSPSTETFTTLAPMTVPRLYHSLALLLPDGRVAVSGGGRFNNGTAPTDRMSAEYFSPPYLFKGARPTITSAPTTLQYSQPFTVQTPNAAQIASVSIIRLGSVTHSFNMSQYFVPLSFTAGSGSLTVQGPANANLAPPGYYMLFIVNTNGVPSIAPIVNLPVGGGSTQPPNAPTNLVASGGIGTVNLSWTAATGPNGVAGYSVYRGTVSGFTPSTGNRIGQPSTTSFIDTTITVSGTYYYVVTAQDSTGTSSSPSNQASIAVSVDSGPPTPPSSLAATTVSNSQINLSWTASTDDVAVAGYRVERCLGNGCTNFTQIGTPTATTFTDSGLAASSTYNYRVRAADTVGNLSDYSNVATAATSAAPPPPPNPVFIQRNSAVPQSGSVATVSATFTAAQTAGNLNVVIVGWNDTTTTITAVTDTAGNTYTRAIGPTLGTNLSQSIYYAANIAGSAAGANAVKVTFSKGAAYPDLRILEYSGIDSTTPVDVTGSAVGSSATSSSSITTTNASDLLVAGNMVATSTTGAGSGFTSRVITSPDGDIAEDSVVTATGTYSAAAPLSSSGSWVMQVVAFRAAGSVAPAFRMMESGSIQ